MPELPEVEIVKQSLENEINQKKIKKVVINNRNLRLKIPLKFEKKLENKVVKKVLRFSKYLILNFHDDTYCLIHLGMTGTIHLIKKKIKREVSNISFYGSPNLPKKHNHIIIKFKSFEIIYNDPRRFGFFKLLNNKKELKKNLDHLGPEPFFKNFNLKYLTSIFSKKERNIKNFLLDQKFVSGIGNIYASEILFLCKINPLKKVKKLSKNECIKIIKFSRKVLNIAIKKGGSSIRDFKNISGNSGNYQKEFKVYQRENLSCFRKSCNGKIKKKFISNRSTYFCNICQK